MPYKLPAAPEPDGLPTPEVRIWTEDKYRLVSLYDRLFSTGMKRKWDTRVYIDLYAGAGFVRIKNTDRLLFGSPLLALDVADPFDKYIFCEENSTLLNALERRVSRLFPKASTSFILGDCNDQADSILARIPAHSKTNTVLSFCFVDPYGIDIKFSTIQALARRRMDFLVLLALHMDANRNIDHYTSPANAKLDEFLGNTLWRKHWQEEKSKRTHFARFLANEYSQAMQSLGYLPVPFYKMKEVRSDEKNLPLYHLAFFSKHELGYKYWDEVLQYGTDQINLGF